MSKNGNIYAHIIEASTGKIVAKERIPCTPRKGDEIRLGGEGAEKYYSVVCVVWVYDEPENPFYRVNIGVEKRKDTDGH